MSDLGGFIQIRTRLREMEALLYERAALAADEIATYLETYAKNVSPSESGGMRFKDRTGNLRQSEKGSTKRLRRDLFTVILEATMSYATFVEKVSEGKYAYIWPSIADNQGRIMEIWHKRLAL